MKQITINKKKVHKSVQDSLNIKTAGFFKLSNLRLIFFVKLLAITAFKYKTKLLTISLLCIIEVSIFRALIEIFQVSQKNNLDSSS